MGKETHRDLDRRGPYTSPPDSGFCPDDAGHIGDLGELEQRMSN